MQGVEELFFCESAKKPVEEISWLLTVMIRLIQNDVQWKKANVEFVSS